MRKKTAPARKKTALCWLLILSFIIHGTTGCAQNSVMTDVAIDGYKGPVKEMTITTYVLPDEKVKSQLLLYYPYITMPDKIVQEVLTVRYNKNGMYTYQDRRQTAADKLSLVGDYILFSNDGKGKVFDEWGQQTGFVTLTNDGKARRLKQLNLQQQPEWETAAFFDKTFRSDLAVYTTYADGQLQDSFIRRFTYDSDGLLKQVKIQMGSDHRSSIRNIETLKKDAYGNPLQTRYNNWDGSEQYEEYSYIYYNSPEEKKAEAAAALLQPDAAHPQAGCYSNNQDEANTRLYLFNNGRFALHSTHWKGRKDYLVLEERGTYRQQKDSILFIYDQPDSSMYLVYARRNTSIPAGTQHYYFLKPPAREDEWFFCEAGEANNAVFSHLGSLERSDNWKLKVSNQQSSPRLWLTDTRLLLTDDQENSAAPSENTQLKARIYGFTTPKEMNEWRILLYSPEADADKEKLIAVHIGKDKQLHVPPNSRTMPEYSLKLTTLISGSDIEELTKPISLRKLNIGNTQYQRIDADKTVNNALFTIKN